MSEYPWNKKNNTFTWLSSLYNLFNDKAFLEKFRVKESSILIGLENFGARESLIMSWSG